MGSWLCVCGDVWGVLVFELDVGFVSWFVEIGILIGCEWKWVVVGDECIGVWYVECEMGVVC